MATLPGCRQLTTTPNARPSSATAFVSSKHGPQDHLIVDETLWRCAGNRCSGEVVDRGNLAAWACRKVRRAAGSVDRFVLPSTE